MDLEPPCTISPSHPHHLYHLTTLAFKCAASRSLHVHKTNAELFFHMTAVLTIAALTVVRLPACCPITQTLAEKEGGADILGAAGVGLTGTIPVVFRQGNDTLTTMATAGQPLSSVRKLATISASGDVYPPNPPPGMNNAASGCSSGRTVHQV